MAEGQRGQGAMPDGDGPMGRVQPTWGLREGEAWFGPKGGLHPRFPGHGQSPTAMGREGVQRVVQISGPLRQQWLGMRRYHVVQAIVYLVYVFPSAGLQAQAIMMRDMETW